MGSAQTPPGPNAVHLCIDMQNLFAPGGPWATPWMEKALPNSLLSPFTRFIPPANASEANGMWRTYYRKWSTVTRDRLNPDLMELVPELGGFVPPASVIDRMVDIGQSGSFFRPGIRFLHKGAAHGVTVTDRASLCLERASMRFDASRLRQVRLKAFRLIAFFRQRLEVGSLRARHRVVARDPIVRLLLGI